MFRALLLLLLAALTLGQLAHAQDALQAGRQAFRQEDYAAAVQHLREVSSRSDQYAEAQYLLARAYLKSGASDRAGSPIKRALRARPDNLRYLTVRLRQHRRDTTSIAPRMERLATRRRLAERILEQRPDHVFARAEKIRTALDDLHWYVSSTARHGTSYFEKRMNRTFKTLDRQIRQLVELDPERRATYRLGMEVYAFTLRFEQAQRLMRTMRAHLPGVPTTWLYSGLAAHQQGRYQRAERYFERGLALLPPGERAAFHDMQRIRSPQADSLTASERQRYWAQRDPRYLTPPNERHTAHYARLVLADLLFGKPRRDVRGWNTERGRVLVRYGLPNDPIATNAHYQQAPGLGSGHVTVWDYSDFRLAFEDPFRNGAFRLYSPPATAYETASPPDYRLKARTLRQRVPSRYQHTSAEERAHFSHRAYAFQDSTDRSLVYVAYQVPGARAPVDTLHAGVFLLDSTGVQRARRRPFPLAHHPQRLVDRLRVPAGTWPYSVEFELANSNLVGYERDSVVVPAREEGALSLSDMVLARRVERQRAVSTCTGCIQRKEHVITPAMSDSFAIGQPLYLYVELYGLHADASGQARYNVEATLTPVDEEDGLLERLHRWLEGAPSPSGVAVRFEGWASASRDEQYLLLDTKGLAPGRYHLQLSVHDQRRNAHARRQTSIFLQQGKQE